MVAILSPDAVSNVRMTADGYFQADLPEGYRYELVEAVVEMSPRPGTRHDDVLERLAELLCDYCRFRFERFARFQPRRGDRE